MAGPMGIFQYVSDNGTTYQVRLDASNAAAMGATAAAGTEPYKPLGIKPRYILAQHPTSGRERKLVAPDPTDAVWTGTGGTMSLVDYAATPVAAASFNIRGRVGEKRYAR